MTQKAIGPSFYDELVAHGGLVGEHFSWQPDGVIEFFHDTPQEVIDGVKKVYEAHNPETVPPKQAAQAALAAGLEIVSTGTPELNGTYALDQLSRMDIVSIEIGVKAGQGFPGGGSAFNYPDASGKLHEFNESNFCEFATAVRQYSYALNAVIAGTSMGLPESPVTIA